MPDVRVVVDSGAAGVDANARCVKRLQIFYLAGEGVI